MAFDLVIRNGTVVDGSGADPYLADVGVQDGRITEIGRIGAHGAQDIDADGLAVTPGFIDAHTHMDAQVMWDSLGSSSCWHGVTTVVMGNCGFTLAPVRRGAEDLVVRNLERAEDISANAMAAGIDWSWESFADYLAAVDRQPKAINYAAQIGHSSLRTWAMGPRAFEGPATDEDIVAMERQLADALRAGAFGFTTSRSGNHNTSADQPVASRAASWEEVVRLVRVLGEVNDGVFELAEEDASLAAGSPEQDEYRRRLSQLVLETGVPVAYGVASTRQLPFIEEVAAAGGRLFGLSHSRGISIVLSFRTRLPFDALPEWRQVRAEPLHRQKEMLTDPAIRQMLVRAAQSASYARAVGADPRPPRYDRMIVLRQPLPPNPTVAELASERGVDPVELIIDLALETDFNQLFVQPLSGRDSDDLLAVLKHPRTVMTFSDSGAHVSQIIDSSIQTHLLGHWVRDRQAFTLQEAVRMITHVPAAAWGIQDRGLLREGYAADLNVFDPGSVGPELPTIVSDLPGGDQRLVQKAKGFRATVANGQITFADGEHTGALSGRLLRKPTR
jgi:N-acyl-D-amino-acid deacylase